MSGVALELTTRQGCPACNDTNGTVIYSAPFGSPPLSDYLESFYEGRLDVSALGRAQFELVDCSACGVVYQRERPSDSALPTFYSDVVEAEAADVRARRGSSVERAVELDVRRTIAHAGRPARDVVVLDYGAGTGVWIDLAARFGCETWACELDPVARDRLAASGHRIATPDALPEAAFDFINVEQVLEHVASPLVVVEELARAVRPGGFVRLCVPNGAPIRALLAAPDWTAPKDSPRSLNAVAPLEHLQCFDHRALAAIGQRSGLRLAQFPLRSEIGTGATLRSTLAAVGRRVRPPSGTLLYFQRPG